VIAMITEAALRREHPEQSLYSFWQRLLERAHRQGGMYTVELYFDLLREESGDPDLTNRLRGLADTRLADPTAAVSELLRASGLPAELRRDGLPASLQRKLGTEALVQLMRSDCNGKHSLRSSARFVELSGLPGCRTLREAIAVDRIGPYGLATDGARAYDEAFARCSQGEPVELGLFGTRASVALPCAPIAARRPAIVLKDVLYP